MQFKDNINRKETSGVNAIIFAQEIVLIIPSVLGFIIEPPLAEVNVNAFEPKFIRKTLFFCKVLDRRPAISVIMLKVSMYHGFNHALHIISYHLLPRYFRPVMSEKQLMSTKLFTILYITAVVTMTSLLNFSFALLLAVPLVPMIICINVRQTTRRLVRLLSS